ncbi:MAG: AMP-binding protein, partial [Micromonosporaceae bacterium]
MSTIVELLRRRAETQPGGHAFYFIDDDASARPATYADLDRSARAVAAALGERGAFGERVLLLCPPGLTYVTTFLGCLYAGAVAVPAYPPEAARRSSSLSRLRALVGDSGARIAVGDATGLGSAKEKVAGLEWIVADTLPPDAGDRWTPPAIDEQSLALLQYTSGSTGTPKGVMLRHANLLHNCELVHTGFGTTSDTIGVSWLPPYHDMGLIGGILQPLYAGFPTVLMAPVTFLRQPLSWLETIARFGATMSGGPNFAFDLCVRKSTPAQRASLDLSRWRVAFCGAEPVRAATLDRFAVAFAPAGFRREAFYPCYGLAEATLIVAGGQPPRRTATGHMSCGRPLGQQRLVVVDPERGTTLPTGAIGEIWLAGPSVAGGYWGRSEETERTFRACLAGDPQQRHYLRTGDLGYLDDAGELVVTGRIKDLIIVRGRSIHPEDLEQALEQRVAGLRPGGCAAFGIELSDEEHVALACELVPPFPDANGTAGIIAAIRQAVAETADVAVATVVLLRPGQVPRTSSGKVQRHACQSALLAGGWPMGAPAVVARWDGVTAGAAVLKPTGVEPNDDTTLPGLVARVLGLSPAAVPADVPLTRLGLDSLRAIELQGALQVECGLTVAPSALLSGLTLVELIDVARTPHAHPPDAARADDLGPADGTHALWLLQRRAPESTAFQISRAARIRSPIDVDALERALHTLVDRHAALRTRLPARDGQPVPEVVAWSGPMLVRHDVGGLTEDALRERVRADADRPFDLAAGPLFRASLYTRHPADHVLLLSLHHTITDFWSLSLLVDELMSVYADNQATQISASRRGDERAPIRRAAADRGMAERLRFWQDELADAPPALELPTSFPRPRLQSFRGDTHQFRLDGNILRAIDEFARENDLTRFAVLTAALAAVLARYAGVDDLVLGAPASSRTGTDHDQLGYFVNPVPLRVRIPSDSSFRELAQQVRHRVLGALDHAVPFPRLVEAIRPPRDPGRPPLLQVLVVLQQPPAGRADLGAFAVADEDARLELGGLDVGPYRLAERGAAFDLTLTVAEVGDGLTGLINYCADLFDPPAMARLVRHLTTLLTDALADPDAPVAGLDLLGEPERSAVLSFAT